MRLVGVALSRLVPAAPGGLPLFDTLDAACRNARDARREERLAGALDDVRARFGFGSVVSGPSSALIDPVNEGLGRDRNGFVLRTPCLTK